MATAKRLVSESRTQLIDCRRLLHIVLFRRALEQIPQIVSRKGFS